MGGSRKGPQGLGKAHMDAKTRKPDSELPIPFYDNPSGSSSSESLPDKGYVDSSDSDDDEAPTLVRIQPVSLAQQADQLDTIAKSLAKDFIYAGSVKPHQTPHFPPLSTSSSSIKPKGASTMDTFIEKESTPHNNNNNNASSKTSASSSSSSSSSSAAPAAAPAVDYTKPSLDTLKLILKDMAIYFAIEKPLSTQANTSGLNQAASYIPGSSLVGARVRVTKHHMLDSDYQKYRTSYGKFLTALHKTKADNGKDQQTFIAALKALKGEFLTNSRYITHVTHLCDQFITAGKAEDKNLLTSMINEAQAFHAPSPIPGAKAKANDVGAYIRKGQASPRHLVIQEALREVPKDYNDKKKPLAYHQLDAEISVAATALDEHMKNKNPDNLELIHVLYHTLSVLLQIHHKATIHDEHEVYIKEIAKEQEILENYRTVYKEYASNLEHHKKSEEVPPPPMTLPEIAEGIAEKCTALSGKVNNIVKLDPAQRKLDPHFALEFMKESSAYAIQPLTIRALSTIQQELPDVKKAYAIALEAHQSSNQKKIIPA